MSNPNPRRRRFRQFGLRSLIVLLFVIGVVLAVVVPRIQNQTKAVSLIESLNGSAWFEHDEPKWVESWRNPDRFRGSIPESSQWIANLIGEDSVQTLIQAEFEQIDCSDLSDSDLAEFADVFNRVRSLQTIRITSTEIDQSTFKMLSQLRHVKNLFIGQCKISDENLEYISQMENLEILNISNSDVTDEGVKLLQDNVHLERLTIWSMNITLTGLKSIVSIPTLRELTLYDCDVSQEEFDNATASRQLEANIYYYNRKSSE